MLGVCRCLCRHVARGACLFVFIVAACSGNSGSHPIILEGDGAAIGHAMGSEFASDIRALFDEWLTPKLQAVPIIINLFASLKTGAMSFPPDYIAEADAMAAAAGVDGGNVYKATAAPDLMTLAGTPFGCSSVAVLPAASTSGAMIVGHNLDFPDSVALRRYWRPFLYRKTGAYQVLSIQTPGMFGLVNGINEKGVFAAVHMVNSKDTNSRNTPVLVAARLALERAATAREAVQVYGGMPVTVPMNVLFTDGREAFVIEATANRSEQRGSESGGILIVANHYLKLSGGSPDARWPILQAFSRVGRAGYDDVVQVIGRTGGFDAAGGDSNVLAVFVDYGRQKLVWGADVDGNDRAAFGPLNEIDLSTVFR